MASGDELRGLLRRFASGIAVVTVELDDGERQGITIGSLVSLSLEPPLVGISIGLQSSIHEPLRRAGEFAINLLSGKQAALAQHFARSGVPPLALWVSVETIPDRNPPHLAGALGWLVCGTRHEYPAGDHTIFVGDVRTVERGTPGPPLVYVEGTYRSL